MTADHVLSAGSASAWTAEQRGRLVGWLVLEPAEDHLLLENVAGDPDVQGNGVEAVARLSLDVTEAHSRVNWGPMKGMRNVVAHTHGLSTTTSSGTPWPTTSPTRRQRANASSTSDSQGRLGGSTS